MARRWRDFAGSASWYWIGSDSEYGFSKKERLLFHQVVRTQYLIAQGFQVLADNKVTSDAWRKIRGYAKEKADYFARQTLAEFQAKAGE